MRHVRLLLFSALCCCAPQTGFGQEIAGRSNAEAEDRVRQFAQLTQLVPQYVLRSEGEEPRTPPFELIAKPILRWTNPVRQTQDGAVFLWHDGTRPAAIMCAFWRSGSDTQVMHEFQSLHQAPLSAMVADRPVWTPREPGVTFQPVPGGEQVADTAGPRLVQMRRIVASYQGHVVAEQQPDERLRMLSQPLYRYGGPSSKAAPRLIDGAIFGLVQTTDPEILVLLEAREEASGQQAWHVAFARMSRWKLNVKHAGEVVWSCDWAPGRTDETYCVVQHPVPQPQ